MNFFCVYIREAHPENGWQMAANHRDHVIFNQPETMEERAHVAQACMLHLRLAMPTLLDDMENSTDHAYQALPERLYIVGSDANILFQSAPGPFGFDVAAWERAIESVAL